MRRSTALALLVAVAIGLFAALILTRPPPDTRTLDPIGSAELAESTAPLPPAPSALPAIAIPESVEVRGSEQIEGAKSEEKVLAGGPQWRLRVTDEATGAPVPDAEVYFLSPRRIEEVLLIDDPNVFFDMRRFYERNSLHRKTNQLGEAEIPVVEGTFWVVALTSGLFGGAAFESGAVIGGRVELALRAAEFLEVLVLSARDRRPLGGVRVALRDEALMSFPVGATSDSEGLARIGPCFVRRGNEPARFVTVHGVFGAPVEAWVRPGSDPRPELLVPDSERLLVRIVDARGRVCPIDGKLALDWPGRPAHPYDWPAVPIRAGTVSIPRVELGLKLSMRADLNGTRSVHLREFVMPHTARDQRVDLQLDPATPIVRVRLARADGKTFGPATWRTNGALADSSVGAGPELSTGKLRGSGWIAFALEGFQGPTCNARFAVHVHALAGDDLGGVFDVALRPGVNELGEWVLGPGSLLCAGRVVDRNGVAIAGRAIRLENPRGAAPPAMLASPAVTQADGRFDLLGWGALESFSIAGQPVPVRLGDRQVTVVD